MSDSNRKFWNTFYKIRYYHSITREQTFAEIKFVREFLPKKKYGHILDFICGFGRHALLLARLGYRVEGFDIDRESIIRAKESIARQNLKNIHVHMQGALSFHKERAFDAAICLYSSIGFLDEKSNELALKNFLRSVKDGGRVILDLMNPVWARKHLIPYSEKTISFRGKKYLIQHERKMLSNPTREKNVINFVDPTTSKKYAVTYMLRLYSLKELEKRFSANNFKIYARFGSFQKRPVSADEQRIIIVADRLA